MPRLASVIGAGVVLAGVAGFLFWIINRSYQINGVGLLRRQDWPINDPWAWVAAGSLVGAGLAVVRAARRAAHARAVRDAAADLGLRYSEDATLPDGADGLPLFAAWSDGRDAMTGTAAGVPVTVFDCTTVQKGGESDTHTDRTVAVLPAAGLPAFDLRPRKGGHRLLGWLGVGGLTFDPAAAGRGDAETVTRFTGRFLLALGDPVAELQALGEGPSADRAEREAAVRRLFTPAVMAAVSAFPDYAAQAANGFLVVWHHGGVLPARKRGELWDAALAIRAAMTHPPGAAAPVVPARAGMDVGRQSRRMRNTVFGGLAGSFVGFVLSAMVMSVLFFRGVRDEGPGLNFVLQPVIFFGLVLLGSAAGAGIGSRLPVRDTPAVPPPDPEQVKARQKRIGCGALAGFFGGFFGGFVLFAASKIAFGWDLADFGLEGAVFFGSIFGTAGLGAVGGGLLMSRLARRKPTPG